MEPVLVPRLKLIKTLEANRERHIKAFKLAEIGWEKKQSAALDKFVEQAKKLKSTFNNKQKLTHLAAPLLARPQNFAGEYDQAIGMLKLSVEENVKLDESDYQQFVKDEWQWTKGWAAQTVGYAAGAGGGGGGAGITRFLKSKLG